jgi:hypothetical protein
MDGEAAQHIYMTTTPIKPTTTTPHHTTNAHKTHQNSLGDVFDHYPIHAQAEPKKRP